LEFGADDAFILVPDEDGAEYGTVKVTLRHLKARHTEPKDVVLDFDRRIQRFSEAEDPRTWKPEGGKAARGRWQSPPADDADQGGDF
jgi:hypothetical protein